MTVKAVEITHILRDGTILKAIEGRVVTRQDAPTAYAIMEQINGGGEHESIQGLQQGYDMPRLSV